MVDKRSEGGFVGFLNSQPRFAVSEHGQVNSGQAPLTYVLLYPEVRELLEAELCASTNTIHLSFCTT